MFRIYRIELELINNGYIVHVCYEDKEGNFSKSERNAFFNKHEALEFMDAQIA